MNNDKICERLDEHEKRIFFNNSFAKNKADELQTSLNELETAVETATTNIGTIQTEFETAETSLNELETLTQTHTSEIADLQTATETNTSTLSSHNTRITSAQSRANTAYTRANSAYNLASGNSSNIGTNTANITNLLTRMTSAENSLDELETAQNSLTTLQTDLDTAETNITNLQTAQTATQTALDTAETNITNLQTAQTATQTALDTAEETITDHETRITTLENSAPLPSYYGTSVGEITKLESDVLENEHYSHNGGNFKFTIGTKAPNGPYGSIFTRINPAFNTQYAGSIKLYLFNIPAGQTTTTLNLTINGTTTALTPNIETDGTITLPFDFHTGSVFNRFDIEFTDTLLAETFLDYIEITATQGVNFACLNKDYSLMLLNYYFKSTEYTYITKNEGSSHSSKHFTGTYISSMYYVGQSTQTINGVVYEATKLKTFTNLKNFPTQPGRESVLVLLPNNTLVSNNSFLGPTNLFVDNVYDASISFNNEEDLLEYCGTKYNLSVFIGNNSTSMAILPTLTNQILPNDFIQCVTINERKVRLYPPFLSGYLLLHKTGEILYYPQKNATYFVKLGKGVEPKAYLQDGRTEIVVYYQNFAKTNVIRKKMSFNTTTNKWEITSTVKLYPNTQEICEYGDDKMYIKQNNTFTIVDRY